MSSFAATVSKLLAHIIQAWSTPHLGLLLGPECQWLGSLADEHTMPDSAVPLFKFLSDNWKLIFGFNIPAALLTLKLSDNILIIESCEVSTL